jgi:hypothetical protein
MRIITRFSLNNDSGSGPRNALAGVLEGAGLVRTTKTATYEGDLTEDEIRDTSRRFWNIAHGYTPAYVDHFWMYADQSAQGDTQQDAA